MINISAKNLSKRFGFRKVFENISFDLAMPSAMAITGPNGSGKSTLLKIISRLINPSQGEIVITHDSKAIAREKLSAFMTFISPEMNFYSELSGMENLKFFVTVSGGTYSEDDCLTALDDVGLGSRGRDMTCEYSSGMIMRLKYALAFLKKPEILIIDEPATNLDNLGKELIYRFMEDHRKKGILIYATNEENEIRIADECVDLA